METQGCHVMGGNDISHECNTPRTPDQLGILPNQPGDLPTQRGWGADGAGVLLLYPAGLERDFTP